MTGGLTGGATGTAQTSISGTLTNPTNVPQTATYTVTPTSGSCAGATFTIVATINPKPVIPAQTATICSGTAFTTSPANSGATIVPASTTYTWTVATNTNVTGQSNQTTAQSSISQTLTNSTNTVQTVVYTVTPTSGAQGSCPGATFTLSVTVNPTPVISNQTEVICSNGSFNITLNNGIPSTSSIIPLNTTYSWSTPTVTGGITGGVSGTSQSSIFGTLSNPTTSVQTATYTVTATSGIAGSCVASTFDLVVTVNPLPVITVGTIIPVNTMDIQFLIPYSTNFTLTNFTLTTNNPNALPSFSVINNTSITSSPLVIPLPSNNSSGGYDFTLLVKDNNGCVSLSNNLTLVINTVKVLDKKGNRMLIPANAINQNGARGFGTGRTENGQIISAPNVATISTNSVSSITTTSAICGGFVKSNGGSNSTSMGVCWSTSSNPTVANSKTIQAGALGTFTSSISGLTSGTTYYVRAYVVNSSGTAYGNEIIFTTMSAPTVTTTAVTSIAATTASSGGTVTATGGAAITAQGVCWSTSTAPTTANSKTIDGTTTPFSSSITGLINGTTYYVRAYATNSIGTSYGNEISFTATTPAFVTTGLKLNLDASTTSSYPGSGTTWTDISGSGNNGTLVNGPTYNSANNGSISFDGVDDYVNCGTPSISVGKITVSAWVKINSGSRFQHIVDSSSDSWHLAILNDNRPYFFNGSSYHTAAPILEVNKWYLITGVQGTTLDIYINGVLGQSIATNANVTTNNINIGRWQLYSRPLNGNIAQVLINNIALSQAEILQFFNATKAKYGYFSAPTVTTTAVTSIAATTASSGGTVTATGGAAITAQGVCWSTSTAPTTANSKTIDGTTSPFTSSITGLTGGTTYYVRAYATNSAGTSYGNEISFTTTSSMITNGLQLHYDASNPSSYPGTGNIWYDLSGNNRNGTLVNNSTFNSTVAGGVLSFNGTNQYISTTYIPNPTCTISIWFYNNLNYSDWNRGIFSTFALGNYNGFYMGTSNIGSFRPSLNFWYNGNSSLSSISSAMAINTWYNITVTSGAGTISIYLNGVLKNTISSSTNHAGELNIGRTRFDSNYWSGYIGNTMVYDRVLSGTEVLQNFNTIKSRFGY